MKKRSKKVRIFSALEVANICGVVNQTAINWIKNGYLKSFTTPGGQYRIYAEDLYDFLNSRGMKVPEELEILVDETKRQKTILVISDDKKQSNTIKSGLEKVKDGLVVQQAFDGFEAGSMLMEQSPGIVLVDLDASGFNGEDMLGNVKKTLGSEKTKVLGFGSNLDEKKEKAALQNGAQKIMEKPLDYQAVFDLLKE
jgi:two-component system, OmpR family, response regulator